MKTIKIFNLGITFILCSLLYSCTLELETGKPYPALEMGDSTQVYKLEQVLQNTLDVKPFFSFFDNVTLTVTYKDNAPYRLTFDDSEVPFRVTGSEIAYDGILDVEWEIYSASSPYEIRVKGTENVICYISKDRQITFPFKLGAPSNSYQYIFVPVTGDVEQ